MKIAIKAIQLQTEEQAGMITSVFERMKHRSIDVIMPEVFTCYEYCSKSTS